MECERGIKKIGGEIKIGGGEEQIKVGKGDGSVILGVGREHAVSRAPMF